MDVAENNLGLSPLAFVVNKNNNDLLHMLNIEISKLHNKLSIFNTCKAYFKTNKDVPFCIL